ncbi:hypothetical protein CPB83DRAFT_831455 [Crepidotus variabilis]|uniref:Uncharacterized protein n=1 Tax=Crepidotus variabilis TaxID=179855 RepID=A0A9P6JUJ5_9AGAR|nr:hypothetical protein CPB83DRAFT_831455 [Crepidotus variabilis]
MRPRGLGFSRMFNGPLELVSTPYSRERSKKKDMSRNLLCIRDREKIGKKEVSSYEMNDKQVAIIVDVERTRNPKIRLAQSSINDAKNVLQVTNSSGAENDGTGGAPEECGGGRGGKEKEGMGPGGPENEKEGLGGLENENEGIGPENEKEGLGGLENDGVGRGGAEKDGLGGPGNEGTGKEEAGGGGGLRGKNRESQPKIDVFLKVVGKAGAAESTT